MMIFGEIPGAIIAIETDFRCFCLKCNLKNGIAKEVYKPVSQRVILEKSKCKECGTNKRTYRKYAAFCKRTYKNMPHYGKQKTNKYSKLKWMVLAPEITARCSDLIPSVVRGMEHTAITNGLKSIKAVNKQLGIKERVRLQQVAIGDNNLQIGGSTPRRRNPMRQGGPFGSVYPPPQQPNRRQHPTQPQQPTQTNYASPYQATQYQAQRASMVNHYMQQQGPPPFTYDSSRGTWAQQVRQHRRAAWSARGYCNPTCMCPNCMALDRSNYRA